MNRGQEDPCRDGHSASAPISTGELRLKIILIGAGRLRESVAGTLVSERNDITVIDADPDATRLRGI